MGSRREMKSHEWTISATEHVEESEFDRSFSDIEDDGYRYDDDGGDNDDDIDDDIDYWRRTDVSMSLTTPIPTNLGTKALQVREQ